MKTAVEKRVMNYQTDSFGIVHHARYLEIMEEARWLYCYENNLMEAFHQKGGVIRGRVPLIKALASMITIGTGGNNGTTSLDVDYGLGLGAGRLDLLALALLAYLVVLAM